MPEVDSLAALAHADLVGRTGATELQVGYLRDGVPVEEADWWATAKYRGADVTVEHYVGPVEALEALARRLLTGGRCTACNGAITLAGSNGNGQAPGQVPRNPVQSPAVAAPAPAGCQWRREAGRWVRGCDGVTAR